MRLDIAMRTIALLILAFVLVIGRLRTVCGIAGPYLEVS
jgi:hypothetical protein